MLLANTVYGDYQDLRQSPIFEDLIFYWKKSMVNKEINNKLYYVTSDHENDVKKIKRGKRKANDQKGIF